MTDTIKQGADDKLIKIKALRYSQSIGKLGSGVAAFSIAHNLNYIPAFRVFYQAQDRDRTKWFTFPNTFLGSVTDQTSMAYADPFLVSFNVDNTNFNFNCVNEDSVAHTFNVVIIIYADRGAGQG